MITTTMHSEESRRSSSYLHRKRHHENPYEEQSKRSRLYPQNTNSVIPHGWLDCPPFGHEIGSILIPSKVPLSESYNDHLPPDKRYTFRQLLTNNNNKRNKKLGLVIDLTNTTRYYNPSTELRREGIEYVKIRCSGRDSVPDNASVNTFVHEVNQFEKRNFSKKSVLVHCTHGHNRTGFMIVHYLMRSRAMTSVTQAIKTFNDARPPGIYKADYIDALYSFYHETKPESAVCPQTPEWKRSENESLSLSPRVPSMQEEVIVIKKMSNDDVLGDEIPYSQEKCYQEFCYKMMNINIESKPSLQFPGSHPVSLDREGFQLLRQRYYYATWKADGTRYMMLLTREGCYLIDRDFRFRRVQMRFPCKPHEARVHDNTLLDGEMVVDNFLDGQGKPRQARRYLVYDMVAINGESLADRPFSERWSIADREVIRPRNEEKRKLTNNGYKYEMEPFGVRIKAFCLLSSVEKKVFNELIPSLSHESDGIILQGWDDPYVYQRNEGLFKWKFLDTVDFLFEVGRDGRHMLFLCANGRNRLMEGHTVEFRGEGWDQPVSYSGKLLECFWDKEDRVWVAMRVRVDKSQPNGMRTFRGVMKSIDDDITKEVLLKEIKEIIRLPMYVERIRVDTQAAERRRHGNRRA
ncbi:GTP--RNA guanylyltransferase [Hirschfeldia incana]|nr:GTP--RNA guanylyltransferase [Hirschfeldia incana]